MGRHQKVVFTEDGLDRRASGYYSTPAFVARYIADRCLELLPQGRRVFDPCVGRGELVEPFLAAGLCASGIDVLCQPLDERVEFRQRDFFELFKEHKRDGTCLAHDFIVANPPYNCHEVDYIRRNRDWLARLFAPAGLHNLYSMFLWAIVELAREGSVIAVITHDSFLTASCHRPLRDKIAAECTIRDLLLAPTDLFLDQGADVRTCILIAEKGRRYRQQARVLNRKATTGEFRHSLEQRLFSAADQECLRLSDRRDGGELVVGAPQQVIELFACPRLAESFPCVTGISTGNDKRFLRKQPEKGFGIPFYKNPGSRKFYCPPDAYLIDDFRSEPARTKNFIVRNKQYLGKSGVACSSMGVRFSAAYRPAGTAFGVNPNIVVGERDCWWLMSYLNSSLATYLVRGVLARTNMITPGYAARLPLPALQEKTKRSLETLARSAYEQRLPPDRIGETVAEIDRLLFSDLRFRDETREAVAVFAADALRLT